MWGGECKKYPALVRPETWKPDRVFSKKTTKILFSKGLQWRKPYENAGSRHPLISLCFGPVFGQLLSGKYLTWKQVIFYHFHWRPELSAPPQRVTILKKKAWAFFSPNTRFSGGKVRGGMQEVPSTSGTKTRTFTAGLDHMAQSMYKCSELEQKQWFSSHFQYWARYNWLNQPATILK